MKNVFIVIAAYNEEKSIRNVIQELKKANYNNIVVVDDGSRDSTFKILEEENVNALRHPINRGQGAALKTGIDYAREQGADIIVTFDADGQHRVEDLPAMLKPVQDGSVDVSLGSRFLKNESNVPLFRKVFLKGGALSIWALYGIRLTDSHNGFRAMNMRAAESIEMVADKMEHASEILEQIKKKELRYVEVPVIIKYTDYSLKHGQSTLNGFRILSKMIFRKLVK